MKLFLNKYVNLISTAGAPDGCPAFVFSDILVTLQGLNR